MQEQLDALARRIDRLERRIRLQRALLALAVTMVAALGAGKAAATLVNDGLGPRLAVSDAAGNDRAWLAVRLDSPVLQFLDPKGMARSGITTFNDDSGLAVVSGTDGSRPGLVLLGDKRSVIWSAP